MTNNFFTITKDQSSMLKGIAICFMLFLHLFNSLDASGSYTPLLNVRDLPFPYWLCRAMNPVAFYLLISGYGMYYTNLKKPFNHKSNLKRVLKLYVYWWICLLCFVPLGVMLSPEHFTMDISTIAQNVSGFSTTWYPQAWFLFPYILIVFSSKYVFWLIDKCGSFFSFVFFLLSYYAASYIISRFHTQDTILTNHLFPYLQCLSAFSLGSIVCKLGSDPLIRWNKVQLTPWMGLIALASLVLFTCLVDFPLWVIIYVLIFVLIFSQINIGPKGRRFLVYIGNLSTCMWFVHAYFCYYIFHDFIYGFNYSILIYIAEVLCSVLVSIPLNFIINRVNLNIK